MPETRRRPILGKSAMSVAVALLLVSLALIAGACDGCDGEDTDVADSGMSSTTFETPSSETTSTQATVSTTTSVPATTTTVHLASSEELLPNGNIRARGYITDVWMDGNVRKLAIDYIDYFSGAEADAMAIADGVIQPGETYSDWFEGGYYRNVSSSLRTYVVSNSVNIATTSRYEPVVEWDPPCSWADFLSFWGPPGALSLYEQQLRDHKWWIERQGDTVVSIEQLWTP